MYEESDLDAGVKAGILTNDAANQLRNLVASRRGAPAADEESFPLLGGLADLMTAVAILLLVGCGSVLAALSAGPLAFPMMAVLVWSLAEHFTRKRRLVFTSYLLLALFVVLWTATVFGISLLLPGKDWETAIDPASTMAVISPLRGLVTAAGAVMGCAAFWLRFRFPIAYAAAAVAALNLAMHLLRLLIPDAPAWAVGSAMLAGGFATLALALWWDMSDIRRQTDRAQTGFWLHAAAGFQIAGASFRMIIGLRDHPDGWDRLYSTALADPSVAAGIATLILACAFCIFALAIDRRSILMSSLAFVLPALANIMGGAGPASWLLSAMGVGGFLLLIATRWTELREAVVSRFPLIVRAQLPRTSINISGPRPIA